MKREESFPSASASTEQWLLSLCLTTGLPLRGMGFHCPSWLTPHSDLWETDAEMSHGGRTDKATAYPLELAELDWASAQRAESTIKNKLIYASIFSPKGKLDPAFSVTSACPVTGAVFQSSLLPRVSQHEASSPSPHLVGRFYRHTLEILWV